MTPARQDLTQLGMIVDFPVVDHRDRVILVPHRLPTPGYVQHRKPTVTQMHSAGAVNRKAIAIGTAMRHCRRHRAKVGIIAEADKPGNTAHHSSRRKLMSSLILYEA
jgi:hypothetical protein